MTKSLTVDQVNALIPQLTEILGELQRLRAEIVSKTERMEGVIAKLPGNGGGSHASEYLLLVQQFQALATTLDEMGAEVKDLESGLVDFRSMRSGREVYLCWRRGEQKVEYWHELDAGFGGRQPL